jgi:hypothetical protein
MVFSDRRTRAEKSANPDRERWIGVYIGILAVFLAICAMGGGNATKDSTLKNIEASNIWGFFQAKNIRRQAFRLQADEFEAMLKASPSMPDDVRKQIQAKVDDYRANEKRLTSEPEKKEGIEELLAKGKELEAARDLAMKRDPYFDYGQALLQIAIVLASVAIISGGNAILVGSFILAVFGTLATIGGFTLAFPLPF